MGILTQEMVAWAQALATIFMCPVCAAAAAIATLHA